MSPNKFDIDSSLEPENMIRLYASGAFPMADDLGKINWYLPSIRAIIPLNDYNIPRSVKSLIKKELFEIRYDFDVMRVIKNCANRETTWISEELIIAYKRLHKRGFVHSVETYIENNLVGGLYGIAFRGAFFGESMFSKVSGASKVALAKLIEHLIERNFVLLDVQYITDHLKMFGARNIHWEEYHNLLMKSYITNTTFL
ncbi:MAG: leucyl/phenylalanyl-tRNA--protein transferase [Ignavibacterium sp.]|nr:leucyl/phenylalanyl-tRNA--protein transferase [Ignavibacterium sp.]MCX7610675.1 leucyl/phenylalanyl-tRNA--protein transferase [Ignavibacterium sp.]MDW8375521.1 leucyl/phenylalanyl-tRNA--protein transferase [Ignavibacteriales bacterium]